MRAVAIILACLVLAGCTTTTVIGPDATFFDPDRCKAWPRKDQGLSDSEYVLRGYEAYRCERDSRVAAGEALKKLSS